MCFVSMISEIFQWKGECSTDDIKNKWNERDKEHLQEELSDVLIYLVLLASRCNVDLPVAALSKMKLNGKKYPISKSYSVKTGGKESFAKIYILSLFNLLKHITGKLGTKTTSNGDNLSK